MAELNYQNWDDARREAAECGGPLRALIGPSKAAVWRRLADAVGGEFIPGGYWRADRVVARFGCWTVTLDTFSHGIGQHDGSKKYTRVRARFVTRDGLTFSVERAGPLAALGRLAGVWGLEAGDPALDGAFVTHASDLAKVRLLVSDPWVRRLIITLMIAQPRGRFIAKAETGGWFGRARSPGTAELCFNARGVIRDPDRLWMLFELLPAALRRMCQIGSAVAVDPAGGSPTDHGCARPTAASSTPGCYSAQLDTPGYQPAA